MRLLLACAAGALALSACQREPAPEAPADAPTVEDAMPADNAAPAASPASPSAATSGGSAMAAGDAGVDTAGAAPANEGMSASPTSQATRDAAKEKAESTNLHPAG